MDCLAWVRCHLIDVFLQKWLKNRSKTMFYAEVVAPLHAKNWGKFQETSWTNPMKAVTCCFHSRPPTLLALSHHQLCTQELLAFICIYCQILTTLRPFTAKICSKAWKQDPQDGLHHLTKKHKETLWCFQYLSMAAQISDKPKFTLTLTIVVGRKGVKIPDNCNSAMPMLNDVEYVAATENLVCFAQKTFKRCNMM